jgi:hypothetical protein
MLTSSLITLIKKDASDWSRDNIRELVNEVHRMCLTEKPVGHMRVYDSTTGKDPILTTIAGTYEYDLDISSIGFNVYTATTVYGSPETVDSPEDVIIFDATRGVDCKVVFKNDPGTSSYYVTAYRIPPEITSESIQLAIPENYHLSHIKEGVIGLIEQADSGRSERWQNFINKLLPSLQYNLNKSNKITASEVPWKFTVKPRGY